MSAGTFEYQGHTITAISPNKIHIYRNGELVDWVLMPNYGLFVNMRQAMRIVREEHNGDYTLDTLKRMVFAAKM